MRICIILLSTLAALSCSSSVQQQTSSEQQTDMPVAGWLEGTWLGNDTNNLFTEIWHKNSDGSMTGIGFSIEGKDTGFSEKLGIINKDGAWYYMAVIKDQNEGKPVYFKYLTGHDSLLVFSNPEHDFPQKIVYRNNYQDSLTVRVEGTHRGQFSQEIFHMHKAGK